MKRFLGFAVFLGFVGLLFYFIVAQTNEKTEKHGYDSMIVQVVSPAFRAANRNGILQNPQDLESLNLSTEQQAKLEDLFAKYEERRNEIFAKWQKNNPNAKSYIPFSAEGESELVVDLDRAAFKLLNEGQIKELYSLEYQSTGWDFVFFEEVQKELKLSRFQQAQIKDLQLERVNVRKEVNREWMQADSALRKKIEAKAKKLKADFESRLLSVLSQQQQETRTSLLGE